MRAKVEGEVVATEATPVSYVVPVEVPSEAGEPAEVVEPVVVEGAIIVVDRDSLVEVAPPSVEAPPLV